MKVLFPFKESTIIEAIVNEMLSNSISNKDIILLIPDTKENLILQAYANKLNISFFSGSENNVFHRFQSALKVFKCDSFVRLTGDNPLLPAKWIKDYIDIHLSGSQIMTSSRRWNNGKIVERALPKGASIDIINSTYMLDIDSQFLTDDEQEHIIPYFWSNFRNEIYIPEKETKNLNFISVDTHEDYLKLINKYEKK